MIEVNHFILQYIFSPFGQKNTQDERGKEKQKGHQYMLGAIRNKCFAKRNVSRDYTVFLIFSMFLTTTTLFSQDQHVVTYIGAKSQSFNSARQLVGWEHEIHKFDSDQVYGSFAVVGELTKSFRPERISQCLFGDDVLAWKNTLTISGSRTQERIRKRDWLADYFGLPTDYKSTVTFRPRVNNTLVEAQAFVGFDSWIPGLYAQVHAPLVYTNWNLNLDETIKTRGTNDHDPGYFNDIGIPRGQLVKSFTQFIKGNSVPQGANFIFQPLQFAKMHTRSHKMVHIAEMRTAIGYNVWHTKKYRVGFNARFAIPTGNRPKGNFLFESIVGNGHHWEVGAGLSTHFCAWHNKETDEHVDLYLDINAMHIFSTRQKRTFDLKEKPNSRYMLAEKLGTPIENNLQGNGQDPIAQFKKEFSPVANFSTFAVDVNAGIQFEFALLFTYTTEHTVTWSFGYSIWKRSCENVTIKNLNAFPENTWALKGDTHIFGFIAEQPNVNDIPVDTAIALSATQSNATINSGDNFPKTGVSKIQAERMQQIKTGRKNPRIDDPQAATAGNNQQLVASTDDLTPANQINTSIQPIFISKDDININSARTRGFSQKIYGHINRRWHDVKHVQPYVGFGTEVDFGRRPGPTPVIPREKCINCALSQWGVWIKGGFAF